MSITPKQIPKSFLASAISYMYELFIHVFHSYNQNSTAMQMNCQDTGQIFFSGIDNDLGDAVSCFELDLVRGDSGNRPGGIYIDRYRPR